ncbi:MAG TPA: hypothetical protein VI386_06725 [Candidatus Sulfotelmatobacter sp.]
MPNFNSVEAAKAITSSNSQNVTTQQAIPLSPTVPADPMLLARNIIPLAGEATQIRISFTAESPSLPLPSTTGVAVPPPLPLGPAVQLDPSVIATTIGSAKISALAVAAPIGTTPIAVGQTGPNRVSQPVKNSTASLSQRSATLQPQGPANDRAALQNEFSLATAIVYPAGSPTTGAPNLHTLVNASKVPLAGSNIHLPTGNSPASQLPSSSTGFNLPTANPVRIASSPGKSAATNVVTSNSSEQKSSTAIATTLQSANPQTNPTPAPTANNSAAAGSTSIAPTSVLLSSIGQTIAPLAPPPPASASVRLNTSIPGPELPVPLPPGPGPVQMAQMVSRATQSEMHIGLITSAFGNVDVRTVVHASDVGLSVGSEKGDLHALLSNELPTIANSLQQQSLRLGQVTFHQGSALSGDLLSGGGSQQQQQQRSFCSAVTTAPRWSTEEGSSNSVERGSSTNLSRGPGLSILA